MLRKRCMPISRFQTFPTFLEFAVAQEQVTQVELGFRICWVNCKCSSQACLGVQFILDGKVQNTQV
jgi:hypothetical protein